MFASGSQLAQTRPANTSTATAYTAKKQTEVTRFVICNTTGTASTFSLYHDDDGSTYDQTTALVYSASIAANTTQFIDFFGAGSGIFVTANGTIGIQSGTSSALTFSIYGVLAA